MPPAAPERGVYFDYNASAPLLDIARDAVIEAMGYTGNASSVHGCGRATRRLLEDARAAVASSVSAAPQEVVFTSGATEANALACAGRSPRRIAATAIEHDSVLAAAAPGRRIPVLADGTVDLNRLKVLLEEEPRPELVAVMLANNETGVIQPVTEAASLAHAAGVSVHCDAVQGWRRMPFSMAGLGVDSLALSAHKAGGPKGVGALVVRSGILRQALLRGGGQERGWRAGTENIAAAAGFGAVAAARPPAWTALQAMRDKLEHAV
ncbi:MAG: aminotransferase class V-fold PLP-dependent enzyme, partial [Rhodospirillales bacterium]|nr:aminotransferase class V-fold PLP-dependent enzyme [Rhodospirillales bacterium]